LNALKNQAPAKALLPGDLVLFAMSSNRIDHAGIYVGEGRFLHAPSSGGKVRIDELQASYWQRTFKGARRVLD
jgi:cell wall-associated NlpC family hydrolase